MYMMNYVHLRITIADLMAQMLSDEGNYLHRPVQNGNLGTFEEHVIHLLYGFPELLCCIAIEMMSFIVDYCGYISNYLNGISAKSI